jgi:hypothetical protein
MPVVLPGRTGVTVAEKYLDARFSAERLLTLNETSAPATHGVMGVGGRASAPARDQRTNVGFG